MEKMPKKLEGLQTGSFKYVGLLSPSRRFDNFYFISGCTLTRTGALVKIWTGVLVSSSTVRNLTKCFFIRFHKIRVIPLLLKKYH